MWVLHPVLPVEVSGLIPGLLFDINHCIPQWNVKGSQLLIHNSILNFKIIKIELKAKQQTNYIKTILNCSRAFILLLLIKFL